MSKKKLKPAETPEYLKGSVVITIRIDDYRNDKCFAISKRISKHELNGLSQYVSLDLIYHVLKFASETLWEKFYDFITLK